MKCSGIPKPFVEVVNRIDWAGSKWKHILRNECAVDDYWLDSIKIAGSDPKAFLESVLQLKELSNEELIQLAAAEKLIDSPATAALSLRNFIMRMRYLNYVLVCALSFMFLFFNSSPATGKNLSSAKKISIFVAVVKIRKGEKIQKNMIVEQFVPDELCFQSAVQLSSLIIGQRPDHDLPPKKVIQESDFLSLPGIEVPFVETTRNVPAGTVFKNSDLKVVQHLYFKPVPSLPRRPTNISAVVGKKARINLSVQHELVEHDIVP
ncbi:MAG: SAF domain-containing protein [Candidatus Obscuribacter sp.]|nr:SAF domain-containing protein [Candidatus Obscuribacter sp.]